MDVQILGHLRQDLAIEPDLEGSRRCPQQAGLTQVMKDRLTCAQFYLWLTIRTVPERDVVPWRRWLVEPDLENERIDPVDPDRACDAVPGHQHDGPLGPVAEPNSRWANRIAWSSLETKMLPCARAGGCRGRARESLLCRFVDRRHVHVCFPIHHGDHLNR
ncbi:hypothetical protein [Methylobacterium sp. CM6244]